jgi:hypothetical protein
MAQRNQIRTLLGGLDGGNSGDANHIAFFVASGHHHVESTFLHLYTASSSCNTVCVSLLTHIYHVGLASFVKMSQFVHAVFVP